MTGEDARDDVELGKRAWPRSEKVGVLGDGKSDDGEAARETGEDIFASFLRRNSTSPGNFNGISSRMFVGVPMNY